MRTLLNARCRGHRCGGRVHAGCRTRAHGRLSCFGDALWPASCRRRQGGVDGQRQPQRLDRRGELFRPRLGQGDFGRSGRNGGGCSRDHNLRCRPRLRRRNRAPTRVLRGTVGEFRGHRAGLQLVHHPDRPRRGHQHQSRDHPPEPLRSAARRPHGTHVGERRPACRRHARVAPVEVLQHLVDDAHAAFHHHHGVVAAGVSSTATRTCRRSARRAPSPYARSSDLCARMFTSRGTPRLERWMAFSAASVKSAGPE